MAPGAAFVTVKSPADLTASAGPNDAMYLIVTHGLMSQKEGPVMKAICTTKPFDMTAIDEAQAYNAADTNRVKALIRTSPSSATSRP